MSALHQIGHYWVTNNHKLPEISSGGTFVQNGLAYGLAVVGPGTYKLPDNGLPMYVRATGAVTLDSVAEVNVAVLASGQVAYCVPLTSTTWCAAILTTGGAAALPNSKFTTSSTATTVVPTAGALTGAKHVYWENTADGTLALTTRTAAEMFADIPGAFIGLAFDLTIVNRGNNTITVTGGTGVGVVGENTIATLVTRTYQCVFEGDISDVQLTVASVSKGTIET